MTVPLITLNDGVTIPQLGFGVWQVDDAEVVDPVLKALEVGYRHIDTAAIYGNERGVGKAIAESGVARDQLFVTSKLWNDSHKKADARRGIEETLKKLGLDQLDLYLIHWPATVKYGEEYIEAWDALQEFKAEGLTRSVGVSNFTLANLDTLNGETPSINQIEMHPSFPQLTFREELRARGITPEAYSPLGNQKEPSDLELPAVKGIAEQTGLSPAQVIIRWHLQIGNIVIPKSVTPKRIEENFDVFGAELTPAQVDALSGLDSGHRQGADPETADF
ncbi:aldo/keto reductase [Aestuariimicrobium sp. p3-SID1156]|uniref:aldo/keto reductase n=1 Tax=Aestuariimicrobium sp. p3-SID1156 TaxID=2916038 RepID=UPI00223AF246|nr:aldo/keto reductase [Aestuariimicrobium sp. p3-SID1156]MCT1458306.1 aldo/keto reductase [Aestuariimicrobium sp. p3-SID1156]